MNEFLDLAGFFCSWPLQHFYHSNIVTPYIQQASAALLKSGVWHIEPSCNIAEWERGDK